jgi:ubiquinone/menaquinone biosynthesis C-methylase UbiE
MDICGDFPQDVRADFRAMPFRDGSFDVIVFDPPHLPTNAASENSSRIWETRYGITGSDEMREADNVSAMFAPFLVEAKRVLRPEGIVLAKIADLVHNHKYQWQQVDFVNAARAAGTTACDMMIKSDPKAGNLKSSKWKNVKHLRKNHSYWIVVRNSSRCEAR